MRAAAVSIQTEKRDRLATTPLTSWSAARRLSQSDSELNSPGALITMRPMLPGRGVEWWMNDTVALSPYPGLTTLRGTVDGVVGAGDAVAGVSLPSIMRLAA
jgi:hypothetical protein